MTVAELSELRGILENSDVEYKVVKNTLAKIASSDTGMASAKDSFAGPVGIAIGYRDAVLTAKGILDYSRKNEKLAVRGGVFEGIFYGVADLKTIAALPPKEVLLGMLVGAMASPLSKLAYGFSATLGRLGHALNALKAKKEKQ
jgi:large subunit ribosomal protein L10